MKVALDTNVVVAAFASRGLCEAVFEVCLIDHEIVLSEHILAELSRALASEVKVPRSLASDILEFLHDRVILVSPAYVSGDACRDAADLPVLGTALAAAVNCLVTGDRDLLELVEFQSIPILSPREFHDRLC